MSNGMFGNTQPQAALQVFDSDQIAAQFTNLNFSLGQPYDGVTPQIVKHVVNEIQNAAVRTNHPIRIGMFGAMSVSFYNNSDFMYLMKVITHRFVHSVVNREFNSTNESLSAVIPRVVKACACGMANMDPAFMTTLNQDDANATREQAQVWAYLMELAEGRQPFVPFNQYAASNQFQPVSNSTREALAAAANLANTPAGNFYNDDSYVSSTPGGNNGGVAKGKYARRLEAMQGTLKGSIQEAMGKLNPDTFQFNAPVDPPASPPIVTAASLMRTGSKLSTDFDSDVTDFTRSLDTPPEPVAPPEALFTLTMGNVTIDAIREIFPGDKLKWVPSLFQRHHPAICKRTHRIRYFETSAGTVFAAMEPLSDEEKELTMDYNAHAIDPTKGLPDVAAPKAPVREEAKVLYAEKGKLELKIKIHDINSMEEDINGCVRNVLVTAGLSDEKHDAHVKKGITNTPVLYSDAVNAADDLIVTQAIINSPTLAAAAALMKQLHNPQLREMIDHDMVDAINKMCKAELSIPVSIESFADDAGGLIAAVRAAPDFGDFFADAIAAQQSKLLRSNVIVTAATEIKEHAQATLSVTGVDLSDEKLKSILFVQRNVMTVWVNFTDDELALELPDQGAGHIQESSFAALYGIVKAAFTDAGPHNVVADFRLVTVDNVRYDLFRSLIGPEIYLISKSGKTLN